VATDSSAWRLDEAGRANYQKGQWGKRAGFGSRPALLIVDFTLGYVDDASPMGCAASGQPAVAATARLLAAFRAAALPVLYSRPAAWANDLEAGRWPDKLGAYEPVATPEVARMKEIVPELAPREGEPVIVKFKPSAFFGTTLAGMLVQAAADTVVIAGMTTSGCVRATVVDAFSYNFRVIVPRECVADRAEEPHQANLFDIDMKYGDVVDAATVLDHVAKGSVTRG
jgi:nicotinamidase-related amidase